MTTLLINTAPSATTASSSRIMVTSNLFEIPTGACSLAISIAKVGTDAGGPSAGEKGTVVVAQPVSNPDIAGIGILVAFLATAYGIFLWMLIAYFCCWLPSPLLGQVDEYIFKRPARKRTSPPWWQKAVDQSILAYADLQIATGVGILTAAFSTMNTMSVYHLQVAIYLAWMSSNTHLSAVSLLQTDFRENKKKSIARRLRIAGMALLGVMLLVALVPTTCYNWLAIITQSIGDGRVFGTFHKTALSSAGIPARCFWQRQYSGGLTPDAAWSFIILVVSYFWKGLLLFRPSQQFLKVSCRRKMQEPLQRLLDRVAARLEKNRRKHREWLVLRYKLALCAYLAVWALFELAQSFVISLWICGAGLVWGSFQILEPRHTLPPQTLGTESSWTFSQILPVLLLALPILSFAEGYTIQKAETSCKHSPHEPPVSEEPSGQHVYEESTLTHTAIGHYTNPQAADTISLQTKSKPWANPNIDTKPGGNKDRRRVPKSEPPWRCDKRIYESRFVRSCFWGSQLGILSLTALFVVFYFELFVPLGVPGHLKLQATLMTDYGIWFIVGCTILGWLGMAVLLLVSGSIFSSLFKVNDGSSGEEA